MSRASTCGRSSRYLMRSLPAVLLRLNAQTPQKYGRSGMNLPFGPAGLGKVQQSAATCGASRLATAQAEGGFQIRALLPEISARLLEASSYCTVSAGMNGISRLQYSIASRTVSVSTVMLPLASSRFAPNAPNVAPQVCRASVLPEPQPRAKVKPALWQASAALSCVS